MDYAIAKASELKQLLTLKTEVLDGGTIDLYQNDITPTPDTVVGDLDVATFTGYAQVTLTTFSAPYLNADGAGAVLTPLAQFNTAAPYTVGNVVYGYWIEDVDGALLLAGRFPNAPITMAGAGDHIAALIEYALGNAV